MYKTYLTCRLHIKYIKYIINGIVTKNVNNILVGLEMKIVSFTYFNVIPWPVIYAWQGKDSITIALLESATKITICVSLTFA